MGKIQYAVLLSLLVYVGISIFVVCKLVNRTRNMLVPSVIQVRPQRGLSMSTLQTEVKKFANVLPNDFTVKLKSMLEFDRTNFEAESIGHKLGKIEKNADILYPSSWIRNAPNVEGSGLGKESRLCKYLVSGTDRLRWKAIKKIKLHQKKFGLRVNSDKNLTNVFDTCDKIWDFMKPTTFDEGANEKPIAYSILLNRPADQTFQLLKAIYQPSNVYCLHVHTEATKRFTALIKKLTGCVKNILMADSNHKLIFATYERIKAHLSCHRVLLNSTVSWRYLINIPGSVFPLRNNTIIADYLEQRAYLNSISYSDSSHKSFLKRISFAHVITEQPDGYKVFTRTKRRKSPPPYNMKIFRSDTSFIATREFTEFVATSNVSKELLEWAKDTKSPDEFFWATLDRLPGTPSGTPYRKDQLYPDTIATGPEDVSTSYENDLVTKLWRNQRSTRCGGKYSANLCTFNYKDLRWLLGQDSLFADSFDIKVDNVVIGCLHKNLKHPLVEDYKSNLINY